MELNKRFQKLKTIKQTDHGERKNVISTVNRKIKIKWRKRFSSKMKNEIEIKVK